MLGSFWLEKYLNLSSSIAEDICGCITSRIKILWFKTTLTTSTGWQGGCCMWFNKSLTLLLSTEARKPHRMFFLLPRSLSNARLCSFKFMGSHFINCYCMHRCLFPKNNLLNLHNVIVCMFSGKSIWNSIQAFFLIFMYQNMLSFWLFRILYYVF